MKKFQNYAIAAAAMMVGLAGCTIEGSKPTPPVGQDGETAYVSIKIDRPLRNTRASGENAGTEGDITSAYIVTFDDNGTVVRIPEGGYFISIPAGSGGTIPSTATTNKVGAATTKIMVVANPGTKVMAALNALAQGSTLTVFNQAIASITATEIQPTAGIFTMISSPADAEDEDGEPREDGDVISTPLIDVDPAVVGDGTGEYPTDGAAIAAAQGAPITVRVERLASKLHFNVVSNPTKPTGSWFEFTSWTVDALNTTFYPYASRTLFDTNHTLGNYTFNFYTQDPNYADNATYHEDGSIVYATVPRNATDGWAPVLPWSNYYGWMNDIQTGTDSKNVAYLVENTMAAAAQRYGNATRVVIKGKYTPPGFTEGADWFRFGGTNYQTLANLQAAYSSTTIVDQPLKDACDAFLTQVKAASSSITAATFMDLTQAQLDAIAEHGGEVAKVPESGVGIRWFQDSVNYWFYEIRHDQEITGTMAFGKYGVVRNNWYNLTLNEVSGFGTPWYPDLIEPGDGDPQPEDPIDSKYGYIGITITPANWIVWDTGIKI